MSPDSAATLGQEMASLMRSLFPLCRSITGAGTRSTLRVLAEQLPLTIEEVASGTSVLDWTIPKEWTIRDAYVKNAAGERVIDFRKSNLHVVNYSVPFRGTLSLQELKPHLHSLPDRPDWIPYRTSYYKETWGFCLPHRDLLALPEGRYEVVVDSTLQDGHLCYGEYVLPGKSSEEILLTTHVCHPSLANDNLSGVAVAVTLARLLAGSERFHTFRFLFLPGTIGSITWLSRNRTTVSGIRHGLVLTGLGDAGPLVYKKTRRGDAAVDRAAAHVLGRSGRILEFSPYGYDERQFNSPGFQLPVGRLSRTPHGEYPEYHTSGDNLDFVKPQSLSGALQACLDILQVLEQNRRFRNLSPYGEPQLGRRGIYHALGGVTALPNTEMALLWVLNYSDGQHDLLDIAERSGLRFAEVAQAKEILVAHGLLEEVKG